MPAHYTMEARGGGAERANVGVGERRSLAGTGGGLIPLTLATGGGKRGKVEAGTLGSGNSCWSALYKSRYMVQTQPFKAGR